MMAALAVADAEEKATKDRNEYESDNESANATTNTKVIQKLMIMNQINWSWRKLQGYNLMLKA